MGDIVSILIPNHNPGSICLPAIALSAAGHSCVWLAGISLFVPATA